MTSFAEFDHYQAEALLICLGLSFFWAAALYAGALKLNDAGGERSSERLWTAALLFAVLPTLIAPAMAALGLSLRPAPETTEFVFSAAPAMIEAPVAARSTAPKPEIVTTEQMIGAAALLYIYGVILTFALWVARQAGLRYAVARAFPVEGGALMARVEDWSERFGVRMPEIRRSRHVSSVCITGVVRQTILIPHGIESRISTDDLILMCAHEIAHVKRGDTRLFTATQLTRVLFWFNPLVARIAAQAEFAAEKSADALVVGAGVDRRQYAACFVEGLKFAASRNNVQPALAPSFTPPDRSGRRRRLNAILNPQETSHVSFGKRLLLTTAGSTVALIALGQAALAVDPETAADRRSMLSRLPVIGDVTLAHGDRAPGGASHSGLDIKAPKGASVFAPGDGVVVVATDRYADSAAWGKVVVIDHGHGLTTRYAHLDSYSVKKGDRVRAGDIIAKVGVTGKTTGPHLHFETLRDGAEIDPQTVVIAATPAISPEGATNKTSPVISPALPADATRFSYALTPKPLAAPEASPVIAQAVEAAPSPALALAAGPGLRLAYAGPDPSTLLIEDMEERLLGAADGEFDGSYNLSFSNGDKTYHFSSDEPMTAEKRAELRKAVEEMREKRKEMRAEIESKKEDWRRASEKARKSAEFSNWSYQWSEEDADRIRKEARKAAKQSREEWAWSEEDARKFREQASKMAEEAGQSWKWTKEDARRVREEARRAADEAKEVRWSDEDREALRESIRESRLASLEAQRDALEEARDDLEDSSADFEDQLADLDETEAELEEDDLSPEDRIAARAEIRAQRRSLERGAETHRRAIENARQNIERQLETVERQLNSLEGEESDD